MYCSIISYWFICGNITISAIYQAPGDTISITSADILVAGAGPSGCAVAVGLRNMGYSVTLVHSPRPWRCCEGISARTCEGLRNAGLHKAHATVATDSARRVSWNGQLSSANTEHLVVRPEFDAALLQDASDAGVLLVAGRVRRTVSNHNDSPLRVEIDTLEGSEQELLCNLHVDARGRAATASGTEALRGPGTVSLLQVREGKAQRPGTFVTSFADGWAWLATLKNGLSFLQLTVTSEANRLPKRTDLDAWFTRKLTSLTELAELRSTSRPIGNVVARGSTSILQTRLFAQNTLRVGDAAMAVDPLSGNGIFQSLSSALIAPAVINTLLRYPDEQDLALQFYQSRVHHSFFRFARMGRDFYRMETQWPENAFWKQRQDWPDSEAAHNEIAPKLEGVEPRPVLLQDRICEKAVAITSDQPLGVWHVAGVELACLLEDLPASPAERESILQERLRVACVGEEQQQLLRSWLHRYGLISKRISP